MWGKIIMPNRILSIFEVSDLQNADNIIWDLDCYKEFCDLEIMNNRLFNVLEKISYKAVMGIAVLLTELIQQRSKKFFPNIDIAEEFASKVESLWAGAVDPLYLETGEYDWEYYDENGDSTTYMSNWFVLKQMLRKYVKSSFYIHRYLINLSMLARYLMPNKKLFDDWFAETLRKTAEVFPCTYNYNDLVYDKDARYDCSVDAPVPREFFFDPEFEYSEDAAKSVLNVFLQSLDYKKNPWLRSPKKMKKMGFKGTPYEV